MRLFPKILLSVLLIQLLGGLGAAITSGEIKTWYVDLDKPPGTPPNWLFGPMWITLYAMIAVAFALVWHRAEPGKAKRVALWCFAAQMLLNLIWTPVFFGLHQMFFALLVIVALWVSYATYLNAGNWWLNR